LKIDEQLGNGPVNVTKCKVLEFWKNNMATER